MEGVSVKDWIAASMGKLNADAVRSAETNLIRLDLPERLPALYIKDESTHPTGSLKHRLARSLFTYALCNGWLRPDTVVVEASSGSTAVSEAFFARLLGLRFLAVVPRGTSPEKVAQIELYGGRCLFVPRADDVRPTCLQLSREENAYFMDQFTFAERAVDWRGRGNIAAATFAQLSAERFPVPKWLVCGAGTGGTATTFGRYIRHAGHETRLCLADPEGSIFHRVVAGQAGDEDVAPGSIVEGVGRPRLEPSFMPQLIDRAIAVPDAASIGAARALSRRLGKLCGGSTGTNLWAAIALLCEMRDMGEDGSVVMLLCDTGERYRSTVFGDDWLAEHGIGCEPFEACVDAFFLTGEFPVPPPRRAACKREPRPDENRRAASPPYGTGAAAP